MTRPSRESVLEALKNVLAAGAVRNFTADLSVASAELANPSSVAGLLVGLPVFGDAIPKGALITGLSPLTISRKPTANALQTPITTGFATVARRVKFPRDMPLPALAVKSPDEDLEYHGAQQLQQIKAEAWIATAAGEDPDVVPETALNNLLDAIQGALVEDDPQTRVCTLGGLVNWCRMSGKVEKDTGDIGPIAVAVADILITVP